MSDEELIKIIEKAIQGDEKAFVQLCEMKGRDILYFSVKLMGNWQDGEDAAQEILLQMQKWLPELQHPKAFHMWMYRIINSVCIDMHRKNTRGKGLPLMDEEMNAVEERKDFLPYDFVADEESKKRILEIIDGLPYRSKMCVFLFYYQNMKYEEISETLSITMKEVDNALYYAKKSMRKILQKEDAKETKENVLYMLGPVPLLAKLIQSEMAELIPEEAVKNMLLGSSVTKMGELSSESASAYSAGASNSTVAGGMSAAAKTIIGLVVTVGIAVGGSAYIRNKPTEELDQGSSPVGSQEQHISQQSVNESAAADDEFEINVLEDMIGNEPALELRSICSMESADYKEVQGFLEEQGMTVKETVGKFESKQEFTLYTLQKQKKILMVIVKYKQSEQQCNLTYQFTDAEVYIPRSLEIEASYENWK